jgi:hypothetical protein
MVIWRNDRGSEGANIEGQIEEGYGVRWSKDWGPWRQDRGSDRIRRNGGPDGIS